MFGRIVGRSLPVPHVTQRGRRPAHHVVQRPHIVCPGISEVTRALSDQMHATPHLSILVIPARCWCPGVPSKQIRALNFSRPSETGQLYAVCDCARQSDHCAVVLALQNDCAEQHSDCA